MTTTTHDAAAAAILLPQPPVGITRDEKHRYSWNGGPKVPGVTSVMKALDKSGPLVGWAKRETAACAVRNLPLLTQMVADGGPVAAVEWLKRTPDYQRDTAAELGTLVHALAEAISRGQEIEVDSTTEPFITALLRWRAVYQPKVLNAEYMVYSEAHRYGGTADMAARINGEVWLIDIKTGKGAYAETALQLAGLHYADWAGRTDDPKKYQLPRATRFGVLHVRPEGAELIPYDVTPDEFQAFVSCRYLTEWLELRAPVIKIARKEAA
jgi:hypothetical protein